MALTEARPGWVLCLSDPYSWFYVPDVTKYLEEGSGFAVSFVDPYEPYGGKG